MALERLDRRTEIIAALGPTNTGKTHHAVKRMLEHDSGMIGLPLRLLAREVYDRVRRQAGEANVALITGEEKKVPANPRYWVSTTEAMPTQREVDFVAVDEIQLATHRERGHVFTDRILNARGRKETWLMGSSSMRRIVRRLVPTATVETRPRLSRLSWAGPLRLSKLPPRSAVVAFTARRVYELAERLRYKKGGAAVVLGALSPRARNAQIGMYQAGEVDYLVATDAIGMGLNMDVSMVAFSSVQKFDGQKRRHLDTAELAQIAGRAGRHLRDGRFATLDPLAPLADETVFAIENHVFPDVRRVRWRNSELDFSSLNNLAASLKIPARRPECILDTNALDNRVFMTLSADNDIRRLASRPSRVRLLWDVCQIPDYRQLLMESHAQLVRDVFVRLASTDGGVLGDDWLREQIEPLADVRGEIETLMSRIAFVRTWNYVANHAAWVADSSHWRGRTQTIEDQLSDALHEAIVHRFVETRNVHPLPISRARPRQRSATEASEGRSARQGFGNRPFAALSQVQVAQPQLKPSMPSTQRDLAVRLSMSGDDAISFGSPGRLLFEGQDIALIVAGRTLLSPQVKWLGDSSLPGDLVRSVHKAMTAWLRRRQEQLLRPLLISFPEQLSAEGRGLVHRLTESLGTTTLRPKPGERMERLTATDRAWLRARGIKQGRQHWYVKSMLSQDALTVRVALCAAAFPERAGAFGQIVREQRTPRCLVVPESEGEGWHDAIGYPSAGWTAIRVDERERLIERLLRCSGRLAVPFQPDELEHLGLSRQEERRTLAGLGFRVDEHGRCRRLKGSSGRRARTRTSVW